MSFARFVRTSLSALVLCCVVPFAARAAVDVAPLIDFAITVTDGIATAVPGGNVTYTIVAGNTGQFASTALVADNFPSVLACTWTCPDCTTSKSGTGNFAQAVPICAKCAVTVSATCAIDPAATGTLANTATIQGLADPNPGNDSATDVDTLAPQADLSITNTDGLTSVVPGSGSTTYTITARNAGPSNAPGASVTDAFPASLACSWTCTGSNGGTCAAGGNGGVADTVALPRNSSVTYTAACAVAASATGSIVNTATVSVPAGWTDPTPANNTASDVDSVAPGVVLVTAATPIPTMDALMLLMMMVAVAVVAGAAAAAVRSP